MTCAISAVQQRGGVWMYLNKLKLIAAAGAIVFLAACGDEGDDRDLLERITSSSADAPEEFATLPQKPLILPNDLTALPTPTPGTTSRADLTPREDALAALGGRASTAGPDGRLITALGANRVTPGIRDVLRAEDAEYRAQNRGLPLDRLFGRVTDSRIYADQILDPEAELLRLRARGVWVPQLPPTP